MKKIIAIIVVLFSIPLHTKMLTFLSQRTEQDEMTSKQKLQEEAFQIFRAAYIECKLGKRSDSDCQKSMQVFVECCEHDAEILIGYQHRLRIDAEVVEIHAQQRNKK